MISLVFRTDDGTRWGTGKGSNITAEEFDLNNWELKNAIEAVISDPAQPRQIASFTEVNGAMLITMDDGSTFGPLPLPVLAFQWRADYQSASLYQPLDVFRAESIGIFMVLIEHTTAGSFDPAAVEVGSGDPLYQELFAFENPADDVDGSVTAAGTNQATAIALTKRQSHVTGADGTTGVKVDPALMIGGTDIYVVNEDATDTLKFYPASGGSINNQSANAEMSGGIPANTTAHFRVKNATNLRSVP